MCSLISEIWIRRNLLLCLCKGNERLLKIIATIPISRKFLYYVMNPIDSGNNNAQIFPILQFLVLKLTFEIRL